MTEFTNYQEAKKNYLKTLKQYVPVVDRVHGEHHPEFHEVRRQFESLEQKTTLVGKGRPELTEEFVNLRKITDNYTVPDDVCESYEAVYKMLEALDKAYHA